MADATKKARARGRSRSGNPAVRAASDPRRPREGGDRRILWASNAPWAPTGYGEQTAQATKRIAQAGHEVAIAANYGLEGTRMEWEGLPIFPRGLDVYSNDTLPAYVMDWGKPTGRQPLLITLFDCWVFRGAGWDLMEQVASWVPVDHYPVPPAVMEWLKRPNVTPIAMSRFGENAIKQQGVDCLYVPHAIDTGVFKPTELIQGTEGAVTARQWMDVPEEARLVASVAANKGQVDRKSFAESFLAMAIHMEKHPDVWFYVHTEPTAAMTGLDLRSLAAAVGLPMDRVRFPDAYSYRMGIPREALAAIYTACDVMLQPSRGEGFGIPVVEAQACGVPVIVSNATAQAELCGDGWKVDVQPQWDEAQKAWWFTPLVPSIVDSLEAAYARGRGRSQAAIDFAAQYDADVVFDEYWRPALEVLL